MHTPTQRDEPAKRPQTNVERGAPTTHTASAARKNLLVRVVLSRAGAEGEELREHGYGHGV